MKTKQDLTDFKNDAIKLKRQIRSSLKLQGFKIEKGELIVSDSLDKNVLRSLHQMSLKKKIESATKTIKKHEPDLINYIANGSDIVPQEISPKIILVKGGSFEALLFRYATLHWSIPISSGYGRRLRFLVMDCSNNKLIGIIGLGDPVFALGPRDKAIGWTLEQKKERLYHVMDAFVLGAIPPYSNLLCGKLIAMLALTTKVKDEFRKKYSNSVSLILKKKRKPILAMITTTSAFGRSSMYNRIKVNGREYWQSVGYTLGTGDFHFSNGVYDAISSFVKNHCDPTARHNSWGGSGFRNRREVVKKTLKILEMPNSFINHKVCREVVIAPFGKNTFEFLRGEKSMINSIALAPSDTLDIFRERWLLPRAMRNSDYRLFKNQEFQLWEK